MFYIEYPSYPPKLVRSLERMVNGEVRTTGPLHQFLKGYSLPLMPAAVFQLATFLANGDLRGILNGILQQNMTTGYLLSAIG